MKYLKQATPQPVEAMRRAKKKKVMPERKQPMNIMKSSKSIKSKLPYLK